MQGSSAADVGFDFTILHIYLLPNLLSTDVCYTPPRSQLCSA